MKILERLLVTHVKKVTSISHAYDGSVFDRPAFLVLVDLPACHRFAIKKRLEVGFYRRNKGNQLVGGAFPLDIAAG